MQFGQGQASQGQREFKVPFGFLKSFSIVPSVLVNWSFQSRAFSVFVTSVALRPSTTLLGFIWRRSTRQGSTLNCVLLVFYRDRSGWCALSSVTPASASTHLAHNISIWAPAWCHNDLLLLTCGKTARQAAKRTFVNAKKLLEGERLPSSFSPFMLSRAHRKVYLSCTVVLLFLLKNNSLSLGCIRVVNYTGAHHAAIWNVNNRP